MSKSFRLPFLPRQNSVLTQMPVLRVTVEVLHPENFTKESAAAAAQKVLADRLSMILSYYRAQQANAHVSDLPLSQTHKVANGVEVRHTNLNGTPILDVKVTVDADADEAAGLCLVVFHGGNQITYTPMKNINVSKGVHVELQSSWGLDIVKTCQMQFDTNYSAIYTQFNGLSSGAIARGIAFEFTTSLLAEARITSSVAASDYPIMNGQGGSIYIPSADITCDSKGKIIGWSDKETYTCNMIINKTFTAAQGIDWYDYGARTPAYLISAGGTRYSELTAFAAGVYGEWNWRVVVLSDGVTVDRPPSLPYYHSRSMAPTWNPFGTLPPIVTNLIAYRVDGAYVTKPPTIDFYTNTNIPPYGNYLYETQWSISGQAPFGSFNGTNIDINYVNVSYVEYEQHAYNPFTADLRFDFGTENYTAHGSYEGAVPVPSASIALGVVAWPPTRSADMPWMYVLRYDVDRYVVSDFGEFSLTSSALKTHYGTIVGSKLYGGYYSETINFNSNYRGWLHLSNPKHCLQAFIFEGVRWMYLDDQQVTSVAGVPISDIQSILLDIPLARIKQFK